MIFLAVTKNILDAALAVAVGGVDERGPGADQLHVAALVAGVRQRPQQRLPPRPRPRPRRAVEASQLQRARREEPPPREAARPRPRPVAGEPLTQSETLNIKHVSSEDKVAKMPSAILFSTSVTICFLIRLNFLWVRRLDFVSFSRAMCVAGGYGNSWNIILVRPADCGI